MLIRKDRPRLPYARRASCFLDIETSGLNNRVQEIIEIAIDHSSKGQWVRKIKMENPGQAEPEALRINGYNDLDWESAVSFSSIAGDLMDLIDESVVIIGHNVQGFDIPFIKAMYARNGFNYNDISRAVICTQMLALHHLVPRGLTGLSLASVCTFLNVENEDAHRAMGDVIRCKAVYYKMANTQQNLFNQFLG